ncbi:NAD(P)-dependent oxidoreductase [Roseobacter sp. EG26]|uniref:NAD(P)-dependent oxidoreductase n=1 Tax=Roseobacter sp. EG26 TaxID=3412477 RepID=UPI003CE4CD2D
MNIIVFGASGDVGSRIVSEALARNHSVTAVVRKGVQIDTLPPSAAGQVADVTNTERVTDLMAGHDLAISALRPPDGQEKILVELTKSILAASAQTGVRALIVGGAASLKVPGLGEHTVLTAPDFLPADVVPIAKACQAQFELFSAETNADWTYLCPPAMLMPGERTGQYRIGTDALVVDADGNSAIAMEDFAVAMIDEAQTARHRRERFTVAY